MIELEDLRCREGACRLLSRGALTDLFKKALPVQRCARCDRRGFGARELCDDAARPDCETQGDVLAEVGQWCIGAASIEHWQGRLQRVHGVMSGSPEGVHAFGIGAAEAVDLGEPFDEGARLDVTREFADQQQPDD